MGIPKFFRYISERWPMISQLIEGNQIPEFDNLYLDMNSILHNCTHGNDTDLTKSRLSEEEVFAKIFSYIDHLFTTIKPKKIFYMAIDGVAPRAKMNQQRSRRFRSAMDAETAIQKAINNGDELPKGEPFDTNAITPGTEFMNKLTKNLKYFIHDKISNDSNWNSVKVIFSGHEVPGEGEHKIMDFIRNLRSNDKNWSHNTRHCIYGLDADLIMLGLSTHAPHFALLREEVTFGRSSKKIKSLEEQNFYLLHLSLLREYMELEFKEIADNLKFEYDFEKILDDFILIMFVIGNDFLPNLPDLHLNKGAFPVILQTFKEALLHLDGYINENGTINLQRLKVWLDYLSQFELMNFEKSDIDVEWFNKQLENISIEGERKRARMGKELLLKQQKKIVGLVKPWIMDIAINVRPSEIVNDDQIPVLSLPKDFITESNKEENLTFLKTFAHELDLFVTHSKSKDIYSLKLDIDGINPHETEEEHNERVASVRKTIKRYQQAVLVEDIDELKEEKGLYDDRFQNWKDQYYKDKLNFDEEQVVEMTKNYVEGLQWVLYYYYRGCPSWGWYYHYHYAPRISDLCKGLDQVIKFDKGSPFRPFEQLMAVLPERSKNLIPTALRPLMYEEHSPIIDFYPSTVKLDMNGKTADWEAVVLLPFVDEKRLIEAMKPYLLKLTPDEKERNEFGKDINFTFNPQVDTLYKSPLSGIFSDIEHDHCVERDYILPVLEVDQIRYGILPDAKTGNELLAGFPSLQTIPFKYKLEYNESLVFQQPSRQQSMCLRIEDIYRENNLTPEELSKRYLNKVIYTRWPYLRESKLVAILDEKTIYEGKEYTDNNGKRHFKIVHKSADIHEQKEFQSLKRSMKRNYSKTKAVMLDDIRAIVKVQPVTGLIRDSEGAYVKTFSENPEFFPLQLMVESIINVDNRYKEKAPIPINEEYPENSHAIFLGDYAYGGESTINGYSSERRLKITVEKRFSKAEPTIGKEMVKHDSKIVRYHPSYIIAKELNLNKLFLSRITSRFLVSDAKGKHINVGLSVKFEARHQKVLGYARRNPKGWEYSNLTVNLLKEYRQRFPEFFHHLSRAGNDIPFVQDLLPKLSDKEATEKFNEIKAWIKFVSESFVIVSFESDSLTKGSIGAVEEYIISHSNEIEHSEKKNLAKVPREAILNPRESFGLLRTQRFNLGDRVIYVQDSGKVPLFSKGTVVGYTTLGLNLSVQVLFDKEIVAGNTFGGRLRTKRGLGLDSSFLLNLTDRQFIYHSKTSKKVQETHKTDFKANKASISVKEKKMLEQQKKAEKDATIRKEAAHDLLNLIQKNDEKKTSEEIKLAHEEVDKEATAANLPKENKNPKEKGKIKHGSLLTPRSESTGKTDAIIDGTEMIPANKTVANSVFNAVLNQFDDSNEGPSAHGHPHGHPHHHAHVHPHPQSHPHPHQHTLDPAGLPYNVPTGNGPNMISNGQPPFMHTHVHPVHPTAMGYPPNMNMGMAPPPGYIGHPPPGMMAPNANAMNNMAPMHTNTAAQSLPVNEKGSNHLKNLVKKDNKKPSVNGKKANKKNSSDSSKQSSAEGKLNQKTQTNKD